LANFHIYIAAVAAAHKGEITPVSPL